MCILQTNMYTMQKHVYADIRLIIGLFIIANNVNTTQNSPFSIEGIASFSLTEMRSSASLIKGFVEYLYGV